MRVLPKESKMAEQRVGELETPKERKKDLSKVK